MKVGNVDALYLANRSDDILQQTRGGVQGTDHDPHHHVDAPPLPLLYGVIEGEERHPWVSTVWPPDLGSSLGVRVTANLD